MFEQFPVVASFTGLPHSPDVSTGDAKRFSSEIRKEAEKGPNFAGHFTIAKWGCGSGCISWAIIDAATGKVWPAPFTVSGTGCGDSAEYCEQKIEFRINSELIVVTGARNEKGAGHYFYRWHNGSLSLVQASERK